MLVLTRKINESIMIGPNIEIRVTRIQGDSVRIAIIAPRDLDILRKEIFDAIAKENREAAQLDSTSFAEVLKLNRVKDENTD